MQGDSTTVLDNSAPDMATTATLSGAHGGGGGRSNSGDDRVIVDEADRMNSYGANRWPRQETLALLKIRSDMDSAFRDSSLKGPLWEEVSRKLAELGYHRSAKKCKEKFENVYKYHKRTKDGRTGKSEGKTYRFFDQLEAFESHHQSQTPPPLPPPSTTTQHPPLTTTATLPWTTVTVPSTTNFTSHNNNNNNVIEPAISPMPLSSSHPLNPPHHQVMHPTSFQNLTSHLFSSSTSSSTASDEELQGSRKRKRRWKEFFEELTKDVIKKQEELQNKLLETVEKRDNERIAREEAWRLQELSRINREHEILIQERTTAAAKDAAVIAFLQKMSGQHNSNIQLPDIPPPAPAPASVVEPVRAKIEIRSKENDNNNNGGVQSSSRWPKIEVEALIRLRTSLETKYQENGPKGPLWEEVSAGMRGLGYNRSSKRCKEKWENINKYFKKVKESNKKRSGDSKTCPYFHQLDAMYREKAKNININSSVAPMEPLMVQPEQQWPPQQVMDQNAKEGEEEDDDDDEEDGGEAEEEEEEEGGGGSFQVVTSQPPALLGQ